MKKNLNFFALIAFSAFFLNCSSSDSDGGNPDPDPVDDIPIAGNVDFWLTRGSNLSALLAKQTTSPAFGTAANGNAFVDVNTGTTFQSMDGFGYTLTGGSVDVINGLAANVKQQLLQEVFGTGGIGVSVLRLSIGASDLSPTAYTYNDISAGQTDTDLSEFSLSADNDLIALLQEILAINPNIKLIATPWSAPLWMKNEPTFIGSHLKPEHYGVYAQYFVKYIQEMNAQGIPIYAVTPQNEPLHDGNEPSMYMSADDQNTFIKSHLGPAFASAGITTKIIVYDHNCDNTAYPLTMLNDAATKAYIDGSAFHLYAGDISALSTVHNAHPDRNVYFTEQYTAAGGNFGGDLKWHLKNVVIGSVRNWSKVALEWNLANNTSFGPHTSGGCNTCLGAITVNGSSAYTKNVGFYIIGHVSKFVPAGSVRIASNNIQVGGVDTVFTAAFRTPSGKIVLVAENDGTGVASFNVRYNGEWFTASLQGGDVATFTWDE